MTTTVSLLCPIAETVSPLAFQSAVCVVGYACANGVKVKSIGVTERTLVDTARNLLVKEFLATDSEWAFWMDADMVLPKETIVRLLEVAKEKDAKMVTGIYYQRGNKHFPVCWLRTDTTEDGSKVLHENPDEYDANEYIGMYALPGPEAKEPFEVRTAGMGCVLIHRSVFETLSFPWFKFIDGKCSEDFYFFVTAGKKGFKLWADPSLDLGHIGTPQIVRKEDCYRKLQEQDIHVKPIKTQ